MQQQVDDAGYHAAVMLQVSSLIHKVAWIVPPYGTQTLLSTSACKKKKKRGSRRKPRLSWLLLREMLMLGVYRFGARAAALYAIH